MPSTPGGALTVRGRAREERIAFIEQELASVEPPPRSTAEIIAEVSKKFGVVRRIAHRDMAEVWHRRAKEQGAARAAMVAEADFEWRRRERIADQRGETQAGNVALRERHKLHGLYAAKKLEVSGAIAITTTLDVRIDAIIAVLTPRGRAALDVVLEEIEQARASGALADPAANEDSDQDEHGEGEEQRALPPGQEEQAPPPAKKPSPARRKPK